MALRKTPHPEERSGGPRLEGRNAIDPAEICSATRPLVLRRRGAHLSKHLAHRRLTLCYLISSAAEQRLHLGDLLGRQAMNFPAHPCPVLFELLRELDLPSLRLRLHDVAGIDDEFLEIG